MDDILSQLLLLLFFVPFFNIMCCCTNCRASIIPVCCDWARPGQSVAPRWSFIIHAAVDDGFSLYNSLIPFLSFLAFSFICPFSFFSFSTLVFVGFVYLICLFVRGVWTVGESDPPRQHTRLYARRK